MSLKKTNTNIHKIIDNGSEITDSKIMANTLNKFYVNIGKTIEDKIPHKGKSFDEYLHDKNNYSIAISFCSADEIDAYINKLNVSKACGP